MSEERRPVDMGELEVRLRARVGGDVDAVLRARILRAVARELGTGGQAASGTRVGTGGQAASGTQSASGTRGSGQEMGFWRFAAGVGVAAVLVLNLSMAAAWMTDFVGRPAVAEARVGEVARAIRELEPGIDVAEARRMAVVISALDRIVLAPIPPRREIGRDAGEVEIYDGVLR